MHYWTIFSFLKRIRRDPLIVTVSLTRTFLAVASFVANALFGFGETIVERPAFTFDLATRVSILPLRFLVTAMSLNLQPPGLARFGHLRRTPGKATLTVSVLLACAEPLQKAV